MFPASWTLVPATGRAMFWLKQHFPKLTIKGIEPVEALRNRGFAKGISSNDLLPGDVYALEFPDDHFDMVCEFAVLHHVREPRRAIREMSRVAARMVCISDCNFVGQGSALLRWIKAGIFVSGLWPLANWIKTRGKGYTFSQGDGLAYSYSVFQDVPTLRKAHPAHHFDRRNERHYSTRPHAYGRPTSTRRNGQATPGRR